MNPELDRKLRYLRLSGMVATLPGRNQEAIHHQLAYPEFLELLVEDELGTRRDRLFARRLKQAGISEVKTLENYDWSFNTQIPRSIIVDLATTRFVREHGGVLLIGPPGTGKSHIAIALTVAAIQAGHTALYRALPSTSPKTWLKPRLPAPVRRSSLNSARWTCWCWRTWE